MEPAEGGGEWGGEDGTWGDGQPMYPNESHLSVECDPPLASGQPDLESVPDHDGLSDDDVEFLGAIAITGDDRQQRMQEELRRLQNLLVEAESLEAELETFRPIVSGRNSTKEKDQKQNHPMLKFQVHLQICNGIQTGFSLHHSNKKTWLPFRFSSLKLAELIVEI